MAGFMLGTWIILMDLLVSTAFLHEWILNVNASVGTRSGWPMYMIPNNALGSFSSGNQYLNKYNEITWFDTSGLVYSLNVISHTIGTKTVRVKGNPTRSSSSRKYKQCLPEWTFRKPMVCIRRNQVRTGRIKDRGCS